MSSRKLTVDLHPVFRQGDRIDATLEDAIEQAERRKLREVEIIHGKGSGQLRKRVLRFLERPDVKAKVHRIDKDRGNHGHLTVHFRWQRGQ
ncbi:Smr/MutS family protein [Nitriliruptoraceae bacterium ZYF776]|nr:Smr/MutS family protein [Profundirhabdus halotolerans]